jgi:hypothetical protein
MKAVLAPKSAITHIQKTAPGPPTKMALATPAKFPVPTLEDRLMANAWNEDTFLPLEEEFEGVHRLRSIVGSIVNCTALRFHVKYRAQPTSMVITT